MLVVDWGDIPTWISALTTLGALVAAGWVVRIELRREEQAVIARADERAARERSEQADNVAAWPDWNRDRPAILIRNGSQLPIYNVRLEFTSGARSPRRIQPMPMLAPGDHHAAYPGDIVSDDGTGNFSDTSHLWNVRLRFVDSAGRDWVRDEYGILRKQGVRIPIGTAVEIDEGRPITANQQAQDRDDDSSV